MGLGSTHADRRKVVLVLEVGRSDVAEIRDQARLEASVTTYPTWRALCQKITNILQDTEMESE